MKLLDYLNRIQILVLSKKLSPLEKWVANFKKHDLSAGDLPVITPYNFGSFDKLVNKLETIFGNSKSSGHEYEEKVREFAESLQEKLESNVIGLVSKKILNIQLNEILSSGSVQSYTARIFEEFSALDEVAVPEVGGVGFGSGSGPVSGVAGDIASVAAEPNVTAALDPGAVSPFVASAISPAALVRYEAVGELGKPEVRDRSGDLLGDKRDATPGCEFMLRKPSEMQQERAKIKKRRRVFSEENTGVGR